MGDVLFSLANVARWIGVDAESALRSANLRFSRRFAHMEEASRRRSVAFESLSPDAKGSSLAAGKGGPGLAVFRRRALRTGPSPPPLRRTLHHHPAVHAGLHLLQHGQDRLLRCAAE